MNLQQHECLNLVEKSFFGGKFYSWVLEQKVAQTEFFGGIVTNQCIHFFNFWHEVTAA